MADIFVSYAAQDRARVLPLIERLDAEGWTVWWDRELVAGPSFDVEIEKALDSARCVVVAWSRHSVNSEWCRAEASDGKERGILVPLRIDDVRPPLAFRQAQTPSLLDWPGSPGDLDAVLAGIRACLGQTPDPESYRDAVATGSNSRMRRWAGPLLIAFLACVGVLAGRWASQEQWDEVSPEVERVAVMPLRDLSPEGQFDYIADGLTIELGRQISEWQRFDVLPHALVREQSVSSLSGKVEFVIDGFVSLDDGQVSVSIDVVRLADSKTLWSDTLSSSMTEPRRLQQQLAANLARVFNETVPPWAGPTKPEAYEAYLRYQQSGPGFGDIAKASYWLERTLLLDPAWTQGWLLDFSSKFQLFYLNADESQLERARESITKFARHGHETTVQYLEAYVAAFGASDFEHAEPVLREAARGGATQDYGNLVLVFGLYREAEAFFRHLVEQYPWDATYWQNLAFAYANQGNFTEALEAVQQTLVVMPDQADARYLVALIQAQMGNHAAVSSYIADLEKRLSDLPSGSLGHTLRSTAKRMVQFRSAFVAGDYVEAAKAADWLAQNGHHARSALQFFLIGDARAQRELERARQAPPSVLLGWWLETALLSPEQRTNPFVIELEATLGITPARRLELCKRAAKLPPESGISCDPSNYAR